MRTRTFTVLITSDQDGYDIEEWLQRAVDENLEDGEVGRVIYHELADSKEQE